MRSAQILMETLQYSRPQGGCTHIAPCADSHANFPVKSSAGGIHTAQILMQIYSKIMCREHAHCTDSHGNFKVNMWRVHAPVLCAEILMQRLQ